ncbi:MAG: DUF1631 domain-containing protein [Pseudomonadales bacterium]
MDTCKRPDNEVNYDNDHIHAVNNATSSNDAMPPLVQQIKENSLSILSSYLEGLFASCDDLFFDLSSRAANNNEQNLYFESMRELRIKKNGVITKCRQHIEQCFLDCTQPTQNTNSIDNNPTTLEDGLSLVQDDEIEQNVAINSMVSKARLNNQGTLYQLTTRLDYLIQGNTITPNNNPIDPQQICQSFTRACELLEINIKAKIILYKQFDRLAISRLAGLYVNTNDLLINAGIIPNIAQAMKNPHQTPSTAHSARHDENIPQETIVQTPVTLDELSHLLASIRTLGISSIPNYQAYSANPGPVMSGEELLATISLLQQQLPARSENHQTDVDIRQLIESVLSASNPTAPQAVKETDDDVINLVAMFFDFVLDDRNLPVSMQALISRLQIPILKIALKDKSFFNNSNHPARKLVNRLAETSIGLDDSGDLSKDKTYQRVVRIVQDITESTTEDNALFSRKLKELEKFIALNQHRSSLIEKRISQAAEGKAKTEGAKRATQILLMEKLKSALLPATISSFLIDQWQQLLIITHLKHGEDSPEWLDAVQLIQDLTWACHPQEDEKSKQRLDKIKDHLMTRINTGLNLVINTDEERSDISQRIENIINNAQQGNAEHVAKQPLTPVQAAALGHPPGAGTKSWVDMSAVERQQTRYKKLTYEYIKKAEELPLNTWLSYEDNKDGRTLRCKLSSKIEASDSYIFVNRFGFKVLEKSRKDFAYDMQKNRAEPLTSEPLFERAMSRITGNLKQANSQPGKPA